jgi:hypothetical protein
MSRQPPRLLHNEKAQRLLQESWAVTGSDMCKPQTDMQILSNKPRSAHPQRRKISPSTQTSHTGGRCSQPDGKRERGRRAGAAAGGALGTITKSPAASAMARRVERFALQSVARDILPKSRTAFCLRSRIKGGEGVGVWRSTQHQTAHYSGLIVCGSVWTCPVCAAKISERRRLELQAAIAQHRESGGDAYLLTLTTPHGRRDDLAQLLAMQAKALASFTAQRAVKAVFAEMGEIGRVRAFEVTHGRKGTNNGWHPHYHFLQFAKGGADAAQLMDWRTRLYLEWAKCCERAGLGTPSFQHGLDLQDGSKADKYLSKWGLECEMTKGHIKQAKAGGETPFDLLRAVLADKSDRQAAALFSEFGRVFKGKRQLSWSRGLRARFDLAEEKTDEELSREQSEDAELLGLISVDEWRDVLRVQARGVVLELAAAGGWLAVARFLWFIRGAAQGVEIDAAMVQEARGLILQIYGNSPGNETLRGEKC